MIVLARHNQLDPDAYERIVADREPMAVAEPLLAAVQERRGAMLDHLELGAPAYGVNTGLGYLDGRPVVPADQLALQRAILVGRAAAVGPPLPEQVVRGVMLLRLTGFLSGHVGVSAELCRFIADRLNDGWAPVVPDAVTGAAGEIVPLCHLFETFVGEGLVHHQGELVPAARALAARGVAPYALGLKEGLALVNGAPFAPALSMPLARRAAALLAHADLAAAFAIAVMDVPVRPYAARVGALKGDPGQRRVHARLGELLAGGGNWAQPRQPPVSLRVVPQVHGGAYDVLADLEAQLARELHAVTDSPVFLAASGAEPEGLYATGNFHAQALTLRLDALAVALTQVVNLLEKRLHRLLDARFSALPEQLAREPGRQSGPVTLHKQVVGLCAECRALAVPASVHASDTSAGQEDFQAFTFLAARQLATILDDLELALAYELVALRQARALRAAPMPPALEAAADALAAVVPEIVEDRSLGPDVQRARELVRTGRLVAHEVVCGGVRLGVPS